jgi:cold shock CspA family protein
MPIGTVIWRHPTAGFGFVRIDLSDHNIYAPSMALSGSATARAIVGQRVEFNLGESGLVPKAISLRILGIKPRT